MKKINVLCSVRVAVSCVIFSLVLAAELFADTTFGEIKRLEETEKELGGPIIRPEVSYRAQGYEDPFRLRKKSASDEAEAAKESVLMPSLEVQGIIWGAETPQAIINNTVVKVGSVINDVRVVDINKKGVQVIFHGQEDFLPSPVTREVGEPVKDR